MCPVPRSRRTRVKVRRAAPQLSVAASEVIDLSAPPAAAELGVGNPAGNSPVDDPHRRDPDEGLAVAYLVSRLKENRTEGQQVKKGHKRIGSTRRRQRRSIYRTV